MTFINSHPSNGARKTMFSRFLETMWKYTRCSLACPTKSGGLTNGLSRVSGSLVLSLCLVLCSLRLAPVFAAETQIFLPIVRAAGNDVQAASGNAGVLVDVQLAPN